MVMMDVRNRQRKSVKDMLLSFEVAVQIHTDRCGPGVLMSLVISLCRLVIHARKQINIVSERVLRGPSAASRPLAPRCGCHGN